MAYATSDLTGTVEAPSVTYPNGAPKNAPSGTRVNFKMVNDMWQFFQKAMSDFGITPNGQPDNSSNGYQYFRGVQLIANSYASAIIENIAGPGYSTSEVYVLAGCASRGVDGLVYYNGEVYYVRGNSGPACGGGTVDVLAISSPIETIAGLACMDVVCATSGTGVADFSDLVKFGAWKDVSGTTFTSIGGTVTVGAGDVQYNRYQQSGRTVNYQLRVRNVTVSGLVAAITVSLPFVTTNISNVGAGMVCGYTSNDGILVCILGNTDLVVARSNAANFTTGTNDQSLDLNLTFEVE